MLKRIKKGDTVLCLVGKDAGKKGKVLRVVSDEGAAVVEKLNIVKKHKRPTREFQGGIVEMPAPIKASKLMLVCPKCNKPSRVRTSSEGGARRRVCVKCGELIDKEK